MRSQKRAAAFKESPDSGTASEGIQILLWWARLLGMMHNWLAAPSSMMGWIRMTGMLTYKMRGCTRNLAEMLSGPCMQGRADMKLMAMRHMVNDIPSLHTHVAWDVQLLCYFFFCLANRDSSCFAHDRLMLSSMFLWADCRSPVCSLGLLFVKSLAVFVLYFISHTWSATI